MLHIEKKGLKKPKELSETVNRKKTENTMTKDWLIIALRPASLAVQRYQRRENVQYCIQTT